jgi:hypothetical protein
MKTFNFIFFVVVSLIISSCGQTETPIKELSFEEKVLEMEKKIRATPEWFNDLQAQAAKKNISIDSIVRGNATYMINEEIKRKNPMPKAERIKEVENTIRNNSTWLQDVVKQAKEQNIPVDSAIFKNAKFMVEEEDKKADKKN